MNTPELRLDTGGRASPAAFSAMKGGAERLDVFRSEEGRVFATIDRGGHAETWPIGSSAIRAVARAHVAQGSGRPSKYDIDNYIDDLTTRAELDGPVAPVSLRVARNGERTYLDLSNDAWEAVEVTASGWQVVSTSPVRFVRTTHSRALPRPEEWGSVDELRELLNVEADDDWTLILAWLLGALHPTGPYPLLVLTGEQGSAKTTTARILARLLDPSALPTRALPTTERDLLIAAQGAWVLAFDNLSWLSDGMSDALSRLATGGGLGTRTLWTNGDEYQFAATRPVILTGIDSVVTRSDLLDRSLVVELPPISSAGRRTEEEIWQAFNAKHPWILGGLLNAMSGAVARLPDLPAHGWPRMADFARWATAAESAFGWTDGTFLRVYDRRRTAASQVVVDYSPVAQAIVRLLASRDTWTGTYGTLLELLDRAAPTQRDRGRLPATPKALAGELKRIAQDLRKAGYVYSKGPRSSQGATLTLARGLRAELPDGSSGLLGSPDPDDTGSGIEPGDRW